MDREHGIVGKELMNGRAAGGTTEARKEARRARRAANPIGTATGTKEAREKARARAKARVRACLQMHESEGSWAASHASRRAWRPLCGSHVAVEAQSSPRLDPGS